MDYWMPENRNRWRGFCENSGEGRDMRFTDGYEFGCGAEIGISTQKLHARGPIGLNELTTAKYIVYGDGQVRERLRQEAGKEEGRSTRFCARYNLGIGHNQYGPTREKNYEQIFTK